MRGYPKLNQKQKSLLRQLFIKRKVTSVYDMTAAEYDALTLVKPFENLDSAANRYLSDLQIKEWRNAQP